MRHEIQYHTYFGLNPVRLVNGGRGLSKKMSSTQAPGRSTLAFLADRKPDTPGTGSAVHGSVQWHHTRSGCCCCCCGCWGAHNYSLSPHRRSVRCSRVHTLLRGVQRGGPPRAPPASTSPGQKGRAHTRMHVFCFLVCPFINFQ